MPTTVMALVPHPDDAEYHAGGLLGKFVLEGAKIIIVTVTDGRVGSYEFDPEELARERNEEAMKAAEVLGAEPPIMLGYPDFGLDLLPPGVLREQFVRLIRQHKPDVVVAEDAFAADEVHPDHRAVAIAASDAIQYAGLPLVYPEQIAQGLEAHIVREKYYFAENISRANLIVDVTATMGQKLAALAQHRSQIIFLVDGILQQAEMAGIDLRALFGDAVNDHLAVFTWGMQAQAQEIGQKAGYTYAEAYRYERFHPMIESLLKSTENAG
jgi:LmbE family N-acetylglucosaminyl deacetylase